MKNIKKIGLLLFGLASCSLNGDCDITVLKEIQTLNGRALFDYVESIACQPFGLYDNLLDDYNELFTNKKITLSKNDLEEWLDLYDCIAAYLYQIKDYTQRINYAQKFVILKEIVRKLPGYVKSIKSKNNAKIEENINSEIARVTDIFLIALKLVPTLYFNDVPSINEILKNYKNETAIIFNPQQFFNSYAKLRDYYKAEKQFLSAPAIFNFLYGTVMIANAAHSGSGVYRQQQHAVANFIYMLEQLVYASKNKKNNSWLLKKQFLTPEQIAISNEIIKALYTLFPGIDIFTFSLHEMSKPALLLLSQSRIVLLVLQSLKRVISTNE